MTTKPSEEEINFVKVKGNHNNFSLSQQKIFFSFFIQFINVCVLHFLNMNLVREIGKFFISSLSSSWMLLKLVLLGGYNFGSVVECKLIWDVINFLLKLNFLFFLVGMPEKCFDKNMRMIFLNWNLNLKI